MEDNEKIDEQKAGKSNSIKKVKVSNNSIVILRHRGTLANVAELECDYSTKFGCKVIILESNLDYVGKIDG